MMLELWEVLVPTVRNDGRPIKKRFHKVWDQKVRDITDGLTVLTPVKGQWLSPTGIFFEERMIPVRIACTRDNIYDIVKMTKEYYEQEVIMYYLVSQDVHFFS